MFLALCLLCLIRLTAHVADAQPEAAPRDTPVERAISDAGRAHLLHTLGPALAARDNLDPSKLYVPPQYYLTRS